MPALQPSVRQLSRSAVAVLAAAKRNKFEVIIVDELSRLLRDQIGSEQTIGRLMRFASAYIADRTDRRSSAIGMAGDPVAIA